MLRTLSFAFGGNFRHFSWIPHQSEALQKQHGDASSHCNQINDAKLFDKTKCTKHIEPDTLQALPV